MTLDWSTQYKNWRSYKDCQIDVLPSGDVKLITLKKCLFLLAIQLVFSKCDQRNRTQDDQTNDPLNPVPQIDIPHEDVKIAVAEAVEIVRQRIEIVESHVFKNGGKLGPSSPAYHYYSLLLGDENTRRIAAVAQISQSATHILALRFNLTVGQVSLLLPKIDTMSTVLAERCPTPLPPSSCPPSRYRTIDGTCNNPDNPSWGAANTHYIRILPAWYADGVSYPRRSLVGQDLPPASTVSEKIHSSSLLSHAHVSLLASVWAQFISHDLSRSIVSVGVRGERIKCCDLSEENSHPECFPIKDDKNCYEYSRSSSGTTTYCSLGVREQLNGATAFLDASPIYGTSSASAYSLRKLDKGLLKVQGDWLLPMVRSHTCVDKMKCFFGGDLRLNSHGGRAALQTLLVHEHNRIATELAAINPQWGDDTIFEEARAIVVAEIQHITYKEFLPILLGKQSVERNELLPQTSGFYTGYDISVEPGVFNSVATAILEIYLTLLPNKLPLGYADKSMSIALRQTALNVSALYIPGNYEKFMLGLVTGRSLKFDPSISESLRRYLGGIDLAARAIQQGRDHGITPYVVLRPLCGRSPAMKFEDLTDVMNFENIEKLKETYEDVADVDLFTGILAETPLAEAIVGPTAACLLELQFKVLQTADRYWYENDLPPSGFSKEKLYEIRKVSMSKLLCDNVPSLEKVSISAFLSSDHFLNSPIPCKDIESINLSAWKTQGERFIDEHILHSVVAKGKQAVQKRRQMEKRIYEQGIVAEAKSAVGSAYANNKPNPTSCIMANTSVLLEATSNELLTFMDDRRVRRQTQIGFSNFGNLDINLPAVDISGLVPPAPLIRSCLESEENRACDAQNPFRTISGHCNNLIRPDLGRSNTIFARMLPAQYDDNISAPKVRSVTGNSLPSPRTISTSIHNDISHPHPRYTLLVMQFGQFLDHDITFTPLNKGFQNSILDCRDCQSRQRVNQECWPIPVPNNDPYFPVVNISSGRPFCISFTRSLPGQQTLGAREQINQNTAFLDASHIYGQDICVARELRQPNGDLKTTSHPIRGKPLLPRETTNPECKAQSGFCFKAGDDRSSEQPGLAVIHTIWMREHNRIANQFRLVNRHWDPEKIYQETRRIVTAEWQHVVYNEFLPRVLGWNAMNLYSLRLKTEGYTSDYDRNCNPTILNEFATAAFRFGHSLIRNNFLRMDTDFNIMRENVKLRDAFFNPDMLMEVQMIDELVRGLISTPMETLDNFLTNEITNHLFEDRRIPFSGLDLAALNIQRGRDHGVRSYNEYRAVCNLRRARTFDDLRREIKPELIDKLRRIYSSVDDIDLFTGGLCETPLRGGIIGPTFGCIIGLQFSFLRKCDRFWHETNDQNLKFTEEQLADIRKVTMASLICENCDVVEQIQRGVFDIQNDFANPRVPCAAVGKVNLDLWRDTTTCLIEGQTIFVGASRSPSPCTLCQCTSTGARCHTLRVNCFEIRSRFSLEEILRDEVCRAQCGNVLNPSRPVQNQPQPQFQQNFGLRPPQNQQQISQSRPNNQLPPVHIQRPAFSSQLRPPPPRPSSNVQFPVAPSNNLPFSTGQNPPIFRPPPGGNNPFRTFFPIPNFLRNLFN